MKVKILEGAITFDEFEVGNIYNAVRFADFSPEEMIRETNFPELYSSDAIFVKRDKPSDDDTEYLWFDKDEVKIIQKSK